MKYHKSYDHLLIVMSKGDKIIEKLSEVCRNENILSGFFNGIGAVSQVEMAHFDTVKKQYSYKQMSGALEIVSLTGNITRKDGEVVVHSHISVSAEDMLCYGGHLKEAVVGPTCEITLTDLKTTILRTLDKDTGLNLIQ
ncbi:MAG TPA: PPC domain-containing DNA-binding protein [Planctomycetota bacterium]|nr:PPC domain-containing DNA-binding protein [Planctomycetota bacterium]